MKAVLFDLDDTLYAEIEFVKSGFTVVARHLASKYNLNEDSLFRQLLDILERNGRGMVFDTLLENLGLLTAERVRTLVDLYRSHQPVISLYADTLPTLEKLRRNGIQVGLITDAMASVQKNKVKALGLEKHLDIIIYTEELGEGCSKPSPVPFETALEQLQVPASAAAYIGDDPSKDFLAPNNLGMLTVQVARQTPPGFEPVPPPSGAQYVVKDLAGILPVIEESLP